MSDIRKFKISGVSLKDPADDKKKIEIKDFEIEKDFGDNKEKDIVEDEKEVEAKEGGKKFKLKVTLKGKKGWYWDNTEGYKVDKATSVTTTLEIADQGKAVGASWHKLMLFSTIGLVAVLVIGAIWWWMSSSSEEEKEEEGL